jgi:hypothetical protein
MSYHGSPPDSQIGPPSFSPVPQPAPLRLPSPGPSQRFPDPPTRPPAHPNPYHSRRMEQPPPPPNIPSRLRPPSAITRVEFDKQMAYWPNGRNGNSSSTQGGASSFYKQVTPSSLAECSKCLRTVTRSHHNSQLVLILCLTHHRHHTMMDLMGA